MKAGLLHARTAESLLLALQLAKGEVQIVDQFMNYRARFRTGLFPASMFEFWQGAISQKCKLFT
jgi:hypothetical protein